jgi:branched-chain amino acid transport system substrate-binding protein
MPDLRLDVTSGTRDVSLQLARLAESGPEILLIIAGAEDSARLVQAVRARFPGTPPSPPASSSSDSVAGKEAGAPGPLIFGSHTMGRTCFQELAGPAAEGVRFPLLFAADPGDPRYSRFASRFQAERGRAPDYTAVLTYDATRLLIEAIHRAGLNRARIREALTQLSPWPGLAGPIQFDGTGQNTRTNICLGTVSNGIVVAMNR